tara:strand:- start:177 stop:443 length:267 start_codon:yes stop_codon:yes gene_type:complete
VGVAVGMPCVGVSCVFCVENSAFLLHKSLLQKKTAQIVSFSALVRARVVPQRHNVVKRVQTGDHQLDIFRVGYHDFFGITTRAYIPSK